MAVAYAVDLQILQALIHSVQNVLLCHRARNKPRGFGMNGEGLWSIMLAEGDFAGVLG